MQKLGLRVLAGLAQIFIAWVCTGHSCYHDHMTKQSDTLQGSLLDMAVCYITCYFGRFFDRIEGLRVQSDCIMLCIAPRHPGVHVRDMIAVLHTGVCVAGLGALEKYGPVVY